MISELTSFLLNIPKSKSNPYYSKLSFSGVRMSGVFAEFTPGKFYFSIAAGQLLERQQCIKKNTKRLIL